MSTWKEVEAYEEQEPPYYVLFSTYLSCLITHKTPSNYQGTVYARARNSSKSAITEDPHSVALESQATVCLLNMHQRPQIKFM
ncbi:hypothetical protein FRC05_004915 [Tulasnella sp. 425]|nr:hypothetical protein FRC05_004915 [Tulasnella sp. 425]